MEKDQNIDSKIQNNATEEVEAEELNNDAQPNTSESNVLSKEISPEEKILELEDKNSSMLLAYSFASAKKEKYLYFLLGG